MAVDSKHPDYIAKEPSYNIMRDTFGGEEPIKTAGFTYLPATGGQIEDGADKTATSVGKKAYDAYRSRARFPGHVKSAVSTLSGVMVKEEAQIELPEEMEGLREDATRKHDSLQALLRQIFEQQLNYGRIGLLVDFPQQTLFGERRDLPHIVQYKAPAIWNWDDERMLELGLDELSLVVLDESQPVRGVNQDQPFEWVDQAKFRVAVLEPEDLENVISDDNPLVYRTYVEIDGIPEGRITPRFRGVALEEIPFVFIGESTLDVKPGPIPLLDLARLSIATYCESADYYTSLHKIGGDTFVVMGDILTPDGDQADSTQSVRTGAGSMVRLPEEGDAKYVGIESRGVPEQRTSYQASLDQGREMGARLLEPRKGQAESGEALRTRVASSTATLHQIAITGAEGLEMILRKIAVWMGLDPSEVKVTPNTDFIQEQTEPRELVDLIAAKREGLLMSDQSIHEFMERRNLVKTTFEEEQQRLKDDKPLPPSTTETPAAESGTDAPDQSDDG